MVKLKLKGHDSLAIKGCLQKHFNIILMYLCCIESNIDIHANVVDAWMHQLDEC